MKTAIVVGGGISGIAAATRLLERGVATRLLETDGLLGGRIGTREHGPIEVDLGGRNFSSGDENLVGLLKFHGIDQFVDYDFNSVHVGPGRHVDMRKRPGRRAKLKQLFDLFSAVETSGLFKLMKVSSGARRQRAEQVGSAYWRGLAEQTSDPTALDYFGPRVAAEIIRPWTLRMMASEPDEVYLGNLGPLLGKNPGTLKRVENGMGAFLRAVPKKVDVRLGHAVRSLVIEDGRVVGVEGTADGAPFRETADLVVVTTPAPVAASMLAASSPLATALRRVAYRDVATVVAEYSAVAFPSDLSGLFLPAGCVASHIAKYDSGNRVRFSFAGAAARDVLARSSIEELLGQGEAIFEEFGGTLGSRLSHVGGSWRPGLCAHSRMHHRTLEGIDDEAGKLAGLVLTGDYRRGNSLEQCTGAARAGVDRAFTVSA